ncbi:MAG: maltose ABC transporter substrate-binding protein [Micrococcus sp.]|nr:maltose ABC transporter substrate-binding protein [Micrococcus sp.]
MQATLTGRTSRRSLGLTITAAFSALALTACGGGGGTSSPTSSPTSASPTEAATSASSASPSQDLTQAGSTTITMWVDQNRQQPLQSIVEKFKEDTGITVELAIKDNSSMRDDFITQAPTGEGPDVIVGAHDWIGALVQNGTIEPLQLGDKADEFSDTAIEAVTYEGQTWGVPYSVENIALLRNTELADSTPETFDEMIAEGQKAVEAGDAAYPFVVGLDPNSGDPYHLYPFQTSMGAPVFEQKEDGSYDVSQLAMGGENGVAFAEKLAEYGTAGSGVLNPNMTGDIAKEQFNSGKAAYFLTGPWNLEEAEDAGIDFAVEPIPTMGDEDAQPFVGVNAFFVAANSENKLAANEFVVNYLSTEEAQDSLYAEGKRAPALTASFDKAAEDENVKAFGEIGADGVPMPAAPEMGAVWEFWGGAEMRIIKGEGEAADTWNKMVSDIEGRLNG